MTRAAAPFNPFSATPPRVYTIEPGQAFLKHLAAGVIGALGKQDPAALSSLEVFLPTRRAARLLREEFRLEGDKAVILPRIRTLGDVDEDLSVPFHGAALDELETAPAVSMTERVLTLAKLVAARDRHFHGRENWAAALSAARELSKLLDSFYTEEINPERIRSAAPDAMAAHWARSVEFLEIVTDAWPLYLESVGKMDPAQRRVALIDRQRHRYETMDPDHPVIVAGTTGSAPAVARLMATVASLRNGCVVLPGLDVAMSDGHWSKIDDSHPQRGLKDILENGLRVERKFVGTWPGRQDGADVGRRRLISAVLRPAAASDSWRDWVDSFRQGDANADQALRGLTLAEADNEDREAAFISLKIREVMETPGRTVTLVTPDRDLARRVAAKLRRWDADIDDSAGVPFANTLCGVFLRLVAQWIADPSSPRGFLALLRHPLAQAGLETQARRRAVDAIDRRLRGLRPPGGFEGLSQRVLSEDGKDLAINALIRTASDSLSHLPARHAPYSDWLAAHIRIAEALACAPSPNGETALWRGDDGEAGAENLARLQEAATLIGSVEASEAPAIFNQLVADIAVRRRRAAHPRVAILGPLEARLLSSDVVILGGLNEGVWPRDAAIDPFLSRAMRRRISLPTPEQRIALAAHDFAQLAASPSVLLTRAQKVGGKPATPSRWIIRLKNILAGAGLADRIDRTDHYERLAALLDAAPSRTTNAPAPRPPLAARPTTFFVTRIESLLRDPYSVYARSVLSLQKLEGLDEPFGARHIGNLFHSVFETYVRDHRPDDEAAAVDALWALYEKAANAHGLSAAHQPFWRRRTREAFEWFAAWDCARRQEGTPVVLEGLGQWSVDVGGRIYTIKAKADRIDRLHSGAAALFDYKTGAPPPTSDEEAAFSPQLPLTALIAAHGGFAELGLVEIDRYAYLKTINRRSAGRIDSTASGEDCRERMAEAERGLRALLEHFADPQTAYGSQPRPKFVDQYGDYDHLARRRERNLSGGDA